MTYRYHGPARSLCNRTLAYLVSHITHNPLSHLNNLHLPSHWIPIPLPLPSHWIPIPRPQNHGATYSSHDLPRCCIDLRIRPARSQTGIAVSAKYSAFYRLLARRSAPPAQGRDMHDTQWSSVTSSSTMIHEHLSVSFPTGRLPTYSHLLIVIIPTFLCPPRLALTARLSPLLSCLCLLASPFPLPFTCSKASTTLDSMYSSTSTVPVAPSWSVRSEVASCVPLERPLCKNACSKR